MKVFKMSKKRTKEKKVDSKKDEIEELKNQLARALADYDNLKKRTEKERENFRRLASLGFIARLLPVCDMLEDAQEHLKDPGLAIIIKELTDLFEEEGVERVKVEKDTKFDENLHEAVELAGDGEAKKVKEGRITEEVLSGWRYKNGPVIRPVKVKVSK